MSGEDWRGRAACRGRSELYFNETKRGWGVIKSINEAARLCHECPVVAECDALARKLHEQEPGMLAGLWAGVWYAYRREPMSVFPFCLTVGCMGPPRGWHGLCQTCYYRRHREAQKAEAAVA